MRKERKKQVDETTIAQLDLSSFPRFNIWEPLRSYYNACMRTVGMCGTDDIVSFPLVRRGVINKRSAEGDLSPLIRETLGREMEIGKDGQQIRRSARLVRAPE